MIPCTPTGAEAAASRYHAAPCQPFPSLTRGRSRCQARTEDASSPSLPVHPRAAMPQLPCPAPAGTSPSAPCAGRYQLAVTRRKEEEPTSTSIYNQNDPWTPTVAFADFIDNETITNEVSWGPLGGGQLGTAGAVPAPVPARGFTHPVAKLGSCWAGRVPLSLMGCPAPLLPRT